MAPFCVPAPRIIPLCIPVFGKLRSLDTSTKIELSCDTYLKYEIFYTLDGTKPEPFTKIVQGSKTYKYFSPFCLPSGKITVKAVAVCADIPSMFSNVITKCFHVKTSSQARGKVKTSQKSKEKKTVDNEMKSEQFKKEESIIPESLDLLSGDLSDSSDQNSEIEENQPSDTFDKINLEDDTGIADEFNDLHVNESCNENSDESIVEICESAESLFKNKNNASNKNSKSCSLKPEFSSSTSNAELYENDVLAKTYTPVPDNSVCGEPQLCCMKCKMVMQCCTSCQKMNTFISKFCIQCGRQLAQTCGYCNEQNLSVASFCQYCGHDLKVEHSYAEHNIKVTQTDHGVLVKPELKHIGLQRSTLLVDKHTQTCHLISERKKTLSKSPDRRLPPQSPGRGYWHQQLDYICNHIKTHAYNNTEFRRAISEPVLSTLQSVNLAKDENSVTVTITFSPLSADKESKSEA